MMKVAVRVDVEGHVRDEAARRLAALVPDPTLADAILDRLVHNAYQLNLKGESMRKARGPLNQADHFTP